ncbi:tetratricopeptide repeat domain protein [Colletotrichum incanum]|uniref:Tetratricopeptide repeat domain protein n=1 Tax=Colletotrichum incanum TaxID=1573173 RepID=A0A166RWU4_COLIC|nr:tetratricopeptide repeat domain protein [Colletotrichum incanum]
MAQKPQILMYGGVLGSLPLPAQLSPSLETELKCRRLLNQGITLVLQGEPGEACLRLEQSSALAENKFYKFYAQAVAYSIHARWMQYKWSVSGAYISNVELDETRSFSAEISRLEENLHHARAIYDDNDLQKLTLLLQAQRRIVAARPNAPTSGHLQLSRNQGIRCASEALEDCRAHNVEHAQILALEIELASLCQSVGEREYFAIEIQSRAAILSCPVLHAHHELRLGDAIATPYGVPESWNMVLEQGTESNAQPRDEENDHFSAPSLDDMKAAALHYKKSLALYQQAQHTRGEAAIYLRLGYLSTLNRTSSPATTSNALYGEALEYIDRAKELYKAAGDVAGGFVATAHSCLCRLGMGQYPEDTASAKQIGLWGAARGSYSFSFGLGLFFAKYARRWLVTLGDYEKALAAHRLANAVFEGLGMKLSQAYGLTDQMSVHELLGDQSMIYIVAERALDLCQEIVVENREESPVSRMASNHAVHVLGKIFQRAIKRADPGLLSNVAVRLQAWHRPEEVMSVAQLQLQVTQLGEQFQNAVAEGNMDSVQDLLTRLQDIEIDPVRLQTQATYNLVDHFISTTDVLIPLYRGKEAVRAGQPDRAKLWWRETEAAITAHPGDNSEVYLADLSTFQGDFEAAALHAMAYRTLTLRGGENQDDGKGIQEMDAILRRKRWQDKVRVLNLFTRVRAYEEAAAIIRGIELEFGENWWALFEYPIWETLCSIGRAQSGLGNYENAWRYYEIAMDAFEDRRHALSVDELKVALAGDSVVQEVYFGAACTATQWHLSAPESSANPLSSSIQQAFVALERGKARSLLDLIEGTTSISEEGNEAGQQDWLAYKRQTTRLATLRGLLSRCYEADNLDRSTEGRLKSQIQEIEGHVREMERKLYADPTSLGTTIGTVLELPALCELLPSDTALLQYCYNGGKLVTWKITKSGITETFVRDILEISVEVMTVQYHRFCASRLSDARGLDVRLSEILLPFRSLEESNLIIVPYRALHQLPFHALPFGGHPLMRSKTISYAPSASILGHINLRRPIAEGDMSVLAVGNPSQMSYRSLLTGRVSQLSPLPSAEIEAKAIGERIAGAEVLTGPMATASKVAAVLGRYRVLHFATHGSISAESPMLSAIHLAGGSSVTVEDLMWQRLRADLVVLSACETGGGTATGGDDIVGFARALLAAGARTVVVSLWVVNDDATSYLMAKFYEHLAVEWAPAAALRAAQRAMRQATRRDLDTFLARLRLSKGPGSLSTLPPGGKTRDVSSVSLGDSSSGRGGIRPVSWRAQTDTYSHPKFWAPFIVIGSQR